MKINDFYRKSNMRNCFFEIIHYDIDYELDASKQLFVSNQKITFKLQRGNKVRKIEGIIEKRLVIDSLELKIKETNQLISCQWEIKHFEDQLIRREGHEGISSKLVVINLEKAVNIDQELILEIDIHMPKDEVLKSKPLYNWSFCIHEDISYAVEPNSGQYFMITPSTMSAPFDINLKFPKNQISCIPGYLKSSKEVGDYLIEHYKSKTRNIPVFAISKYKKIIHEKDGFGVEFYLYQHQSINEKLVDKLFEIVQLFVKNFGDNGTRFYKFATIGENLTRTIDAENKGNATYYAEGFFSRDLSTHSAFLNFLSVSAHEIFHNWNIFYSSIIGTLSEWFVEGGANFIAAWSIEKIIGLKEAAIVREAFLMNYVKNEGFNSSETLVNVSKLGGVKSFVLMYYFGALVWEQLKEKVGETAIIKGLRKFFEKYPLQFQTYEKFFACIQEETKINVTEYMQQWINYQTKIKLSIVDVTFEKKNEEGKCEVSIEVLTDKDYELITELVYKFENEKEWNVIPLHINRKCKFKTSFDCKEMPEKIRLDPYFRIPHIVIDKCQWTKQ